MQSYDVVFCVIYILEMTIGVLGNCLFLHQYVPHFIASHFTRPIDWIFINLTFTHILMIFFRGVPWTIHACVQEIFLGDIGCKIISYLQRVFRGLSLCTTCLMSFFQAITITSCSSKWAELKTRVPKCIVSSCVIIWVLNLLVDVIVPLYVTGPRNNTNSKLNMNLGFCSLSRYDITNLRLVILKSLYDAVFMVLMAIASVYMMLVLYRHHQQVQHLRDSRINPIASPETRATKVILFLVIIFVFFYSLSSIFVIVMDNEKEKNQWSLYLSLFFSLCYPCLSPFVLITGDSQKLSCCNVLKRMKTIFP